MRNLKKKLLTVLILGFLIAAIGSVLLPQTRAVTVSDITVDIDIPYGTLEHAATDSDGNIYYGNDLGNIYKSTDGGTTWAVWFNEENSSSNYVRMIFQVDNGDFFVQCQGRGNPIWKYNGTWTALSLQPANNIWHFDQMSNGTILMNPYGSSHPDIIYATDDYGETWRNIDLTESVAGFHNPWHIHSVRVNEFNNDDIWVATGDTGDENQLIKYNNTGWFLMGAGIHRYWKCDFGFDATYTYFLSDTSKDKITRMPHNGNVTTDQRDVLRSDTWLGGTHFGKVMENVDGILVAATRHGMVWASWDGEHWVALKNHDVASAYQPQAIGFHRSNDGAIIVGDAGSDQIYKFFVDEAVLKHLYFDDYVSVSGSSITVDQILASGEDLAIDLSSYGVTDANITLQGKSHVQYSSNSTFESGSLDGWYDRWGKISVTSDEAYQGTCSLNFTPHATWLSPVPDEFHNASAGGSQAGFVDKQSGVWQVSFWAKSNITNDDAWGHYASFKNETDTDAQTVRMMLEADTTWRYYETIWVVPESYDKVHFHITNKVGSGASLFIDNFLIECHEDTVFTEGNGKVRQHLSYSTPVMFTANKTTENPSVTIDGTVKSHSGTLADGENSTTTSITLSSGVLDVTTSVTNSSYVRVIIEATISFNVTNVVIKNRISSGLYNATYFGSPSVTTTPNLIIMADQNTTISAATLTSSDLTITVNGYTNLTSQTLFYCGSKGEPMEVNGTSCYSYNADTNILTISETQCSQSDTCRIYWKLPGDVDGNGIVDIFDIGSISAHWYPGPPIGPLGYDANYDLNLDGAIDIYEIGLVSAHWEQTC